MADSAQSNEIKWYCPQIRGQLHINKIHISRRLKKNLRQMKINGKNYKILINSNFEYVIKSCAKQTINRPDTWINQQIIDAYCDLYNKGFAHSVECWQDNKIVGGLYGIAIGGAFFGESMFSTARDASKVSLCHLVARLYKAGFEILDTQYTNNHLKQFGVFEITHKEYIEKLQNVINKPRSFNINNIDEKKLITDYLQTINNHNNDN